jgi:hypothetical protein
MTSPSSWPATRSTTRRRSRYNPAYRRALESQNRNDYLTGNPSPACARELAKESFDFRLMIPRTNNHVFTYLLRGLIPRPRSFVSASRIFTVTTKIEFRNKYSKPTHLTAHWPPTTPASAITVAGEEFVHHSFEIFVRCLQCGRCNICLGLHESAFSRRDSLKTL